MYSVTLGTLGSASEREAVVTASARSLPALICSMDAGKGSNATCTLHLSTNQIREHGARSTIRDMKDIDPRHHLKQLTCHVGWSAYPGCCEVELARISPGIGNKLWNCTYR